MVEYSIVSYGTIQYSVYKMVRCILVYLEYNTPQTPNKDRIRLNDGLSRAYLGLVSGGVSMSGAIISLHHERKCCLCSVAVGVA